MTALLQVLQNFFNYGNAFFSHNASSAAEMRPAVLRQFRAMQARCFGFARTVGYQHPSTHSSSPIHGNRQRATTIQTDTPIVERDSVPPDSGKLRAEAAPRGNSGKN